MQKSSYEVSWEGERYRSRQKSRPEELYSLIVFKMKEMAETHLGTLVKDAVLTVPADFTIAQRLATREAGLLAGLDVVGIIEEPVAAAIAYGLDKKKKEEEEETTEGNILIFDFGNGTLDVSILSSETSKLRVKSTAVAKFGEEEIEKHLTDQVSREIQRKFHSLLEEGIKVQAQITKDSVEEFLIKSRGWYIYPTVMKALKRAKTDENSITDIVLAGSLTKFPVIQKILQEFFPDSKLHTSINPGEVVATGASIVAGRLTGGNTKVVSEGGGEGAVPVQNSLTDPSLSPVKKMQKLNK